MEQRLTDALSAYKSTASSIDGPAQVAVATQVDIDVKQATWESLDKFVVDVEHSKVTYTSKNAEGLSKARRAFRVLSDHAASARCFTALLPTQSNYGSVLFGGSVVLLEAAHQLSVTRKEIIEALESIPTTLCEMTAMVELYQYDADMHRACARLYSAVLRAYLFIIDWFHRNAFKKFWSALKRQKAYSVDGIQELLRNIKTRREEFQQRADTIHRIETHEIREMQQRMFAEAEVARPAEAQAMEVMNKTMLFIAGRFLDAMREGFPKKRSRQRRMIPERTTIPAARLSEQLEALGLDVTTATHDYSHMLEQASFMPPKDHRKVAETLINGRLLDWFRDSETNVLLVNGHSETESPVPSSMLATKVLEALHLSSRSASQPVTILFWYCSQHFIYSEEDAHPQGMALHLLAQLVAALPGVVFEAVSPAWKAFDPSRVDPILDVIEKVIAELSSETRVFIVLEGVCKYEDSDRRPDLLKVVERLERMAYADSGSLVKVLMTSVQTTNHVYETLDAEQDVIDMY